MFGTTASAVRRAHIYGVKEKMDICEEAGVPFEVAYPPKAGTAAIAPAGAADTEEDTTTPEEEATP